MKISHQPVKSRDGRITSWRFIYYDSKAKRPRYLKRSEQPGLGSIKTEQEAIDFCNRWNKNLEIEAKKYKAKNRLNLYTRKFDFNSAISTYKKDQKKIDKTYTTTVNRVECIVKHLVLEQELKHPADFREINYRRALNSIFESKELTIGGLKKYRYAFNKFLKTLLEKGKIDYEHLRVIPTKTIDLIKKKQENKHGEHRISLGRARSRGRSILNRSSSKEVNRLTLSELTHLLDFAISNPDVIPEKRARAYFIAGTLGLRRGALLALQRRNIEIRKLDRMYVVPDSTIQRFESEESGVSYVIDDPDHIKDVPSEIPVWYYRTRECIEWWLEKSQKFDPDDTGDGWLFPSEIPWRPNGINGNYEPAGKLPIYGGTLSRHFRKDLEVAGLPPMKYKNLRHTAANMVAEITDIETAKEVLGHKSVQTTKRFYLDQDVISAGLSEYKLESPSEKLWKISDLIDGEDVA